MRRKKHVNTIWSHNLAYAIGIMASDGNLSPDGRHLNITSKDKELVEVFRDCLKLKNKIGRKGRGGSLEKKYYVIQFGDIAFYEFLLAIGLTPAKSKTLKKIKIPQKFFFDFVRGYIDGDGNINISKHPESRHKQLKVRLVSASECFLHWIKQELIATAELEGGWIEEGKRVYVLSYGKRDSIKLLNFMYPNKNIPCLKRKHIIAKQFLRH